MKEKSHRPRKHPSNQTCDRMCKPWKVWGSGTAWGGPRSRKGRLGNLKFSDFRRAQ